MNTMSKALNIIKQIFIFICWYGIECMALFMPVLCSRLFSETTAPKLSLLFIIIMDGLNIGLRIKFKNHPHIKSALDGVILAYSFQFLMFGIIVFDQLQ